MGFYRRMYVFFTIVDIAVCRIWKCLLGDWDKCLPGSKYEIKMAMHDVRLPYFFSESLAIRVLCCNAFSIMRVALWALDWKPLLCNYLHVPSRNIFCLVFPSCRRISSKIFAAMQGLKYSNEMNESFLFTYATGIYENSVMNNAPFLGCFNSDICDYYGTKYVLRQNNFNKIYM